MKRADMRKNLEALRLRHSLGLGRRAISAATGLSKGPVSDYLKRAHEAGVTWEVVRELGDVELEAKLSCGLRSIVNAEIRTS
ncbi:MAG: hypothetical protein K1X88_18770 [Nannocystaceae bacterium]|nr:hypothetical protein [Nannocystaceae bacterium]